MRNWNHLKKQQYQEDLPELTIKPIIKKQKPATLNIGKIGLNIQPEPIAAKELDARSQPPTNLKGKFNTLQFSSKQEESHQKPSVVEEDKQSEDMEMDSDQESTKKVHIRSRSRSPATDHYEVGKPFLQYTSITDTDPMNIQSPENPALTNNKDSPKETRKDSPENIELANKDHSIKEGENQSPKNTESDLASDKNRKTYKLDNFKTIDEESDSDDMFACTPTEYVEAVNMQRGDEIDDSEGYFQPQIGELLTNVQSGEKFRVQSSLGSGVYSNVVKVISLNTSSLSAIKILRNNQIMHESGTKEIQIISELNTEDPSDQSHIIRMLGSFEIPGHLCLQYELMETNLRHLLKDHSNGISIEAVRSYARQIFVGLCHLQNCRVMHCDIKPDNLLLSSDQRKVKISDFGSAIPEGQNSITDNIIARFYRPPEIFLGCKYNYAVDVWSTACSLFEIYTGQVLFPGGNNPEMLRLIMELKGCIPKRMRNQGKFASSYFDQFNFNEKVPISEISRNVSVLDKITKFSKRQDLKVVEMFANLLEECLRIDPEERMTPNQALKHPFLIL